MNFNQDKLFKADDILNAAARYDHEPYDNPVTFRVTATQLKRLNQVSNSFGISQSKVLRMAVVNLIENKTNTKKLALSYLKAANPALHQLLTE